MAPTSSSPLTLQHFEKEARNLLHDLRRKDPTAVRRYFSFDPLAGNSQPGLADTQYIIARQYGFRSWQELKRRVLSAADDLVRPLLWAFLA
jgi:hypothetical protein